MNPQPHRFKMSHAEGMFFGTIEEVEFNPITPQSPRKFCVVMLRGMQTRWADTEAQAMALASDAARLFRYDAALGHYTEFVPERNAG